MTSSEGIQGPKLSVTWNRYPGSGLHPKESQETVEAFEQGTTPLTQLAEPPPTHSLAIQSQSLQPVTLNLEHPVDSLNQSKRGDLTLKMTEIAQFAKKHPFLTAGFVIALLLAGLTAYLTVQALLGHTTIPILNAHPELGGGLTFMCLYYSVYLINLCRRAKIKDDLEARIHSHNAFTQELMKTGKVDLVQFTAHMNHEIQNLSKEFSATEAHLNQLHAHVQTQYQEAQDSLKKIQEQKDQLLKLYKNHAKNMSAQTQQQIAKALEENILAIKEGAKLLAPERMAASPGIPEFTLDLANIPFPPQITEAMEENRLKMRTFVQKITDAFKAIKPFLEKNPMTGGMFIVGLLMCVLSGLALYFYFHGMGNIYFFGTMSLMTILPMMIYGISLIYEGYNSSTINALEEELKKIDENSAERKKYLEKEREDLAKIQSTVTHTFTEFTQQWTSFQKIENQKLSGSFDQLKEIGAKNWSLIAAMNETLLATLQPFYPDLPETESTRIFESLEKGSQIYATI